MAWRSRWIEGRYQRYLDYWKLILSNRLGFCKAADRSLKSITQYVTLTATVLDVLMPVVRSWSLLLSPMADVSITLSVVGVMLGLRQISRLQRAIEANLKSEPQRRPFFIFDLVFQTVFETIWMNEKKRGMFVLL